MKKLIHEVLEDNSFSPFKEDSPEFRKAHYDSFDDMVKSRIVSEIANSPTVADMKPEVTEKLHKALAKKDGWRAFAKPICNNYLLAYNYMLSAWHHGGDKVFHIAADLTEALYNTDIEISIDNIKPPFNSFIIYTDGNCIKHIGEYSAPGSIKAINVNEYHVSYIMVEFLNSPYTDTGKIMRMVFGYYDPGTNPEDFHNWNNSSFLELNLEGGGKFRPKDGASGKLDHIFPEQSLFSEKDKDKAKEYNQSIINFIFSFMLYITTKKDDVVYEKSTVPPVLTHNLKKARHQQNQYKEESRYNIYYVGKKYEGIFKSSKQQFAGHELDHKTLVRGHWRDQWYGHREKLPDGTRTPGTHQENIWIEPFFKGIELEEQSKTTIFEVK